jgi:MOSC domain-containing protein
MSVEIGRVTAIYRFPVKSMAGELLRVANLRWQGIEGDRQYGFYRAANTSRFPWLTGREVAELITCSACYLAPDDPRHSRLIVTIRGDQFDINDPRLHDYLSRAAGEEVRLIQVGRGLFDAMPVSILTPPTIAQIAARCGRSIDVRRFRANIIIEPSDGSAREIDWIGKTLIFGDRSDAAKLCANVAIDRCAMITIDPDTAERDPTILRRVVEDFNNEIGVRCATGAPGTIAIGDVVRIGDRALVPFASLQHPCAPPGACPPNPR